MVILNVFSKIHTVHKIVVVVVFEGMSMNDDDAIDSIVKMSTHDDLMIFTNKGKVYRIKGYNVPASGRTSKGIPNREPYST